MPCEEKEEAEEDAVVHTVVIGGGQAGLAVCRWLLMLQHQRSVATINTSSSNKNNNKSNAVVVLEQGPSVGHRWNGRYYWDSLRLLTPNWQTRLPGGFQYSGDDPHGFMTQHQVAQFLQDYAASFEAPVRCHQRVVRVERIAKPRYLYRVLTEKGAVFRSRHVVIATGFCDRPVRPPWSARFPRYVKQWTAGTYKYPGQVLDGDGDHDATILIVGAGATGIQIAAELAAHGVRTNNAIRKAHVVLSVGRHVRWPRRYRGKDICWWMDQLGAFAARVDDPIQQSASPGPQLTGCSTHPYPTDILDLQYLQDTLGVVVVGKVMEITETTVTFDNEALQKDLQQADLGLVATLKSIDQLARAKGWDDETNDKGVTPAPSSHRGLFPVTRLQTPPNVLSISNNSKHGTTHHSPTLHVIWAMGFTRDYSFLSRELHQTLWDPQHEILHNEQGICTKAPGLYVLGYRWMRTKGSSFIDGVGNDAEYLARHILYNDDNGKRT